QPRQEVCSTAILDLHIEFVNCAHDDEIDEQVELLVQQDATKVFDLEKGPLVRAKIIQTAKNSFVFSLTIHHIISDMWSIKVMSDEFLALYNAYIQKLQSPLKPLQIQYKDYSAWQKE